MTEIRYIWHYSTTTSCHESITNLSVFIIDIIYKESKVSTPSDKVELILIRPILMTFFYHIACLLFRFFNGGRELITSCFHLIILLLALIIKITKLTTMLYLLKYKKMHNTFLYAVDTYNRHAK